LLTKVQFKIGLLIKIYNVIYVSLKIDDVIK